MQAKILILRLLIDRHKIIYIDRTDLLRQGLCTCWNRHFRARYKQPQHHRQDNQDSNERGEDPHSEL